MRSDYIKIYKSVHTWTGIISGMALFIAFYAGALTIFKEPLTRWATPPKVQQSVPLAQASSLIEGVLHENPDVAKGFTIHLRELESTPARLSWEVRDPKADDHDATTVQHFGATLDDQGHAKIETFRPAPIGAFIDTLHRVVGLPFDTDPNRWVMGVICTLYALALFSGVIVLLPTIVKDFFALRVGKNIKRMWLDAHNVIGLLSLPFHMVMAVSAVVFAFHDQIYSLQDKLIHEGQWSNPAARSSGKPVNPEPRNPTEMLSPQELLARAREAAPNLVPTQLQYQAVTTPRAAVRIWGKDERAVSPRARGGFIALDPYSGKVQSTEYLPGHQTPANLLIASFFALHMASFGGGLVQWMYFLLGLAGAWLFYSGNLLWVETRRKRAQRNGVTPVQRLDTRLMASATVGVCMGSVAGISVALAASKWLAVSVSDLHAWILGTYYFVFFASVIFAFARGAARAVVPLMWTACACTLLIPVTTLLGIALPQLGWWAHSSAATLGVDAVALIGALCLAAIARVTARRVANAPSDSVWSQQTVMEVNQSALQA